GRHGCTVQTCHEDSVQVLIGFPALELMALSEIVGHDRPILTVRKCRSGRTVTTPFHAVALPGPKLHPRPMRRLPLAEIRPLEGLDVRKRLRPRLCSCVPTRLLTLPGR